MTFCGNNSNYFPQNQLTKFSICTSNTIKANTFRYLSINLPTPELTAKVRAQVRNRDKVRITCKIRVRVRFRVRVIIVSINNNNSGAGE